MGASCCKGNTAAVQTWSTSFDEIPERRDTWVSHRTSNSRRSDAALLAEKLAQRIERRLRQVAEDLRTMKNEDTAQTGLKLSAVSRATIDEIVLLAGTRPSEYPEVLEPPTLGENLNEPALPQVEVPVIGNATTPTAASPRRSSMASAWTSIGAVTRAPQIYKQLIRSREALENLSRLAADITATNFEDTQRLGYLVAQKCGELVFAERCTFYQVVDERELVAFVHHKKQCTWDKGSGPTRQQANTKEVRIELGAKCAETTTYKTGTILQLTEADIGDEGYTPAVEEIGCDLRHVLYAPVKHEDTVFGVVKVTNKDATGGNDSEKNFANEDRSLLTAFLLFVGVCIQRAHLYRELNTSKQVDEVMLDIVQRLTANELRTKRLVKTIVERCKQIVRADRCAIFIVSQSGEKLLGQVETADGHTQEVCLGINEGIAGHVATSGCILNIPDAYADPRFNRALDKLTGYRTQSVLCVPVRQEQNGRPVAVAQLVNKLDANGNTQPFSPRDERLFSSFAVFACLTLRNSMLHENLRHAQAKSDTILAAVAELCRVDIREDRQIGEAIMLQTKKLLKCDRCSLFLFDKGSNELYTTVADNVRPIRVAMGKGIVGHVALHRETLRIPDAYKDPRFNSEVDRKSGYVTRSLLTAPVELTDGQLVAVIQLVNKKGGEFSSDDEDIVRVFSGFAALALRNSSEYAFVRESEAEMLTLLQTQSGVATAAPVSSTGVDDKELHTYKTLQITAEERKAAQTPSFPIHEYDVDSPQHHRLVPLMHYLLLDLPPIRSLNIPYDVLYRLIIKVKSGYRKVPYHNFTHAFDVTQTLYTYVQALEQNGGAARLLNPVDILALLVAGLCHDLDHMGLNNSFHFKAETPLGLLSASSGSRSVLEVHHCNRAIQLLADETSNIFSCLSAEDKKSAWRTLIEAILATDMARHQEIVSAFQQQCVAEKYDRENPDHRRLFVCVLLKAADISNVSKPFDISRGWTDRVTAEFYSQGDAERGHKLEVAPQFDRYSGLESSQMVIAFIQGVVLPLFLSLSHFSPAFVPTVEQLETNKKQWEHVISLAPSPSSTSSALRGAEFPAVSPTVASRAQHNALMRSASRGSSSSTISQSLPSVCPPPSDSESACSDRQSESSDRPITKRRVTKAQATSNESATAAAKEALRQLEASEITEHQFIKALESEPDVLLKRTYLRELLARLKLRSAIVELTKLTNIRDISTHITGSMCTHTSCAQATIFLLDRDGGFLVHPFYESLRIPLTSDSPLAQVARTSNSVLLKEKGMRLFAPEDSAKEETFSRTLGLDCIPNCLIVPAKQPSGGTIAILCAFDKMGAHSFNDSDVALLELFAEQAAVGLQAWLVNDVVERNRRRVDSLLDIAQSLSELEMKRLCRNIMRKARDMLQADRCALFLVDEKTHELWTTVASGTQEIRMPITTGIAGACVASGEVINIPDAYVDSRFNPGIDKQTGYRTNTILCMPLTNARGDIIAVAQMINKKTGMAFTTEDERILRGLTVQAAVALENSKLFAATQELQQHYKNILTTIPDLVVTLSSSGLLKSYNHPPESAFGVPLERLEKRPIGEWWEDVTVRTVNHQFLVDVSDVQQGTATNKRALGFEFAVAHGKSHTVNYTVIAAGGEDKGVVIVLEDVTKEKQMMSTLSKYMPASLVQQVMRDEGSKLGGEKLKASVLFVDIRKFTSISERMAPEHVVTMLNEYFHHTCRAVAEENGVVDKFIGDAVMAVFGVPFPRPEDTVRACTAAWKMVQYVEEMNQSRVKEGKLPLRIGIGLNTDTVLAGNIGSEKRMEYTVIGDGVNLASRIEGVTKLYGVQILCSELTQAEVADKFHLRKIDRIRVVGKTKPISLFEILGPAAMELPLVTKMAVESFRIGHAAYERQNWDTAIAKFEEAIRMNNDPPSQAFRTRCLEFKSRPPGHNWDGVWDMSGK
eukprot:TRINITY_DN16542_c0_g1_i1.p1 TRINITY_DN16542_c0_g1~~TRINITY_DN16542_c0_g1_i1.p1  ORF type:complete len:1937 (+),score=337.07 TRINITY_DN16542_c0_g1_i1:55-5865(+)